MAAGRPRKARAKSRRWRRWLGRAALAVLVVALIPVVLTSVYRVADPVSTLMLWRTLTGQPVERRWVALERIDPGLIRAVLTSEDAQFCAHRGVDWGAIAEAVEEDRAAPRGASTIAMQTVKNLFLWPSRDYARKALEVPLALYADLVLGKRRLLEIYLNVAEWGPGLFGVEAASQHAFAIPAASLTLDQAALLAATLPNPGGRDPAHPSPAQVRLAIVIAGRPSPRLACLGRLGGNLAANTGAGRPTSVYSRDPIETGMR